MAGRFPLYTDADVRGPLIKALRVRGWDVMRAVDTFAEGTSDDPHFEHAAKTKRVLVSNDADHLTIAHNWFQEQRPFRGLIWWSKAKDQKLTVGKIVAQFEKLASQDDIFTSRLIEYLKR